MPVEDPSATDPSPAPSRRPGIIAAGLSVLQTTFSAQFYIAARERLDNA